MAKSYGLEILGRRWTLVESSGPNRSRVLFEAEAPADLLPEHQATLSQWIRSQSIDGLKGNVAVVFGRNNVSLRTLELPSCPAGELPSMVIFSLEGEMGHSLDASVVDFLATELPSGEGWRVVAATMPRTNLDLLQSVLKSRGLTVKTISLRAFCSEWLIEDTHSAAVRGSDRTHELMIIHPAWQSLEISLWRGRTLDSWRSVAWHENAPERLLAEVRRTLLAYHSVDPASDVGQFVLVGEEAGRSAELLNEKLGRPATIVELEDAAGAGALLAALAQQDSYAWPINLAAPKRVVVQQDPRRRPMLMAAALIVLMVLGLVSWTRSVFAARDQRIIELREQLALIDADLREFDPILKRHASIATWTGGAMPWLDEWVELTACMPDTSEAYLASLDLVAGEGKQAATARIQGRAVSQSVVTQTQRSWAQDHGHYRVRPRGTTPSDGSAEFPWQFEVEVAIDPLSLDEHIVRVAERAAQPSLEPKDMERVAVAFGSGRSGPSSGPGRGAAVASSPRTGATANAGSASVAGSGSSAAAGGDASQNPVDRYVAKLKGLSDDEREEALKEVPKFLLKRVLKKLEEEG